LHQTLAARGLEELFFQLCSIVSVFRFLVENRFWCYLLTYLEHNTVVAFASAINPKTHLNLVWAFMDAANLFNIVLNLLAM
jgi:hypothetical protein